MSGAKCIAVIPSSLKASFIFGANYDIGVATCRTAKGWSAPAFFKVTGGSFGFQAGGQASDLVLIIRTDDGMQQVLHAVVRADDQDQIRSLATSLESEAAAGQFEEYRSAPAVIGAAGGHALAVVCAKDETRLQHGGNDGNALRSRHDAIGNRPIRSGHDLAEDGARRLHAIHLRVSPSPPQAHMARENINNAAATIFFMARLRSGTVCSASRCRLHSSYEGSMEIRAGRKLRTGYSLVTCGKGEQRHAQPGGWLLPV